LNAIAARTSQAVLAWKDPRRVRQWTLLHVDDDLFGDRVFAAGFLGLDRG
jgi:hypothetical protein